MTPFLEPELFYRRGARTLPGRYFTSPEIFRLETERLFRRLWLCGTRVEDVASAGQYVLVESPGENLILVRDASGAPRALSNVCRHRGARLCEGPAGRLAGSIRCPYHAWTYGLDGSLLAAPHMDGVPGFERGDYPLRSAAVHEWEGFLFLNLAASPAPFDDGFAPLVQRFARFGLGELRRARRIDYDVRANWKLLFQNFSECLHCPVIHPALAKLSPYRSGTNDLVEGPFLGGYMTLNRSDGSMTVSGRSCGVRIGDATPEDRDRVYYYSIFPNMLLSVHPDYAMVHTLWPEAPDRTRVTCEWLFHPRSFDRADFDPDDAVRFWDMTNRQDWHVCEMSQRGVASSAYVPGPYSPRESLLAAWDEEYLRQLGGDDAKSVPPPDDRPQPSGNPPPGG